MLLIIPWGIRSTTRATSITPDLVFRTVGQRANRLLRNSMPRSSSAWTMNGMCLARAAPYLGVLISLQVALQYREAADRIRWLTQQVPKHEGIEYGIVTVRKNDHRLTAPENTLPQPSGQSHRSRPHLRQCRTNGPRSILRATHRFLRPIRERGGPPLADIGRTRYGTAWTRTRDRRVSLTQSISLSAGTSLAPIAAKASPAGRSVFPGSKRSMIRRARSGAVFANSANALDASILPPTASAQFFVG